MCVIFDHVRPSGHIMPDQAVLNAACAANPRRFTRRPRAPKMPGAAWINKPVPEPDITPHPSLEAA
jgi:hypothetical protein